MINVLTGSNAFLLSAERRRLVQDFMAANGPNSIEFLDVSDLSVSELVATMQAGSLFSEQRMMVLDGVSTNKQLATDIDAVLEADHDGIAVLIVEPKFDKRSSLYKTLKKNTDFREYNDLDEKELAKWIVQYVVDHKGNISISNAQYLLQRIGNDQLRLANEIDKLVLYKPSVDKSTINLLTDQSVQSTVFNLLDAAFAGQAKQTLQIYDEQRRAKVEPQAILAMMAWQLHALAVVKAGGSRSAEEIARQAKLSPFVVRKTMALAKTRSLTDIKRLVSNVLDLDVQLKSASIDADDALKNLLLEITSL